MKLEQTPFCTLEGLSEFSKVLTELRQKLLTVHNLNIKDNAKEDKLEFSGSSDISMFYGRHFFINDLYDFWIGLDINSMKITFIIQFFQENSKKTNIDEMNEKIKRINNSSAYNISQNKIFLDDDIFLRFCENFSIQILLNFTADVFKELDIILK